MQVIACWAAPRPVAMVSVKPLMVKTALIAPRTAMARPVANLRAAFAAASIPPAKMDAVPPAVFSAVTCPRVRPVAVTTSAAAWKTAWYARRIVARHLIAAIISATMMKPSAAAQVIVAHHRSANY